MITITGEVATLAFGVVLGCVCARIDAMTLRCAVWLVASGLGGALVSDLNAEFPHSPEFHLFNVPMLAGVALLTTVVARQFRTL